MISQIISDTPQRQTMFLCLLFFFIQQCPVCSARHVSAVVGMVSVQAGTLDCCLRLLLLSRRR